MCELFAVNRRRQLTRFDSGFQAVDERLMNLGVHLGQLRMNRITVGINLRAEIANQAPIAKVGLLEKVELNIEPPAKTVERLERVVPESFCDVCVDHRKITDKEFETEGFF